MPPSRPKPRLRLAAIGSLVPCGCHPAPPIKVAFIGGLQQPVVLDHVGDSIDRFHWSEGRTGRFAMRAT